MENNKFVHEAAKLHFIELNVSYKAYYCIDMTFVQL